MRHAGKGTSDDELAGREFINPAAIETIARVIRRSDKELSFLQKVPALGGCLQKARENGHMLVSERSEWPRESGRMTRGRGSECPHG